MLSIVNKLYKTLVATLQILPNVILIYPVILVHLNCMAIQWSLITQYKILQLALAPNIYSQAPFHTMWL